MRNSRNGTKNDGKVKKALLLVISAVVAIALGLTCALFYGVNKPSSVDGVGGSGEVVASATTYNNVTGDLRTNFTNGTYKPGDVFNYSYTGATKSVTLAKGTYTLEVWGAQGGSGRANSAVTTGSIGGKGGYSKGTVTFSADTTIYISVGGRGTDGYGSGNPVYYGGFNGGGTARGDCDSNGPAGSGGGATHIATANGLLSALNGNRNAVLIVGGGGGGGGSCGATGVGGYGGGGNNNGGNADDRGGSYKATGGGASAGGNPTGGSAGQGSRPFANSSGYSDGANIGKGQGGQVRGANGSFGRGGDGGGPTNDSGAGGGGGWFGGGGGAGRSGGEAWHSAAGGSGFVKNTLTNIAGTNGNREGHGYARFTIVKITDPPKTKNAIIQGGTRGTNKSVSVAPSVIAEDPDGSPKTSVYFTDGTANAYDTLTTGNNVGAGKSGLFLNTACTTLATNFIDWKVVNSSQILITNIKKYPRAGAEGNTSTVNGDLVLYAKVRDNFGSTSNARTMSVIKFTLRVSDGAINVYSTTTDTSKYPLPSGAVKVTDRGNYLEYTYGTGLTAYNYRVGNSDKTDTVYDYTNNGHIYNTSANIPTVFIPQPLTPNRTGGFTVYAKDIYYDADTAYDVVGIDSVANASNAYYTITKNLDTGTYGSTGLGASITIKPTSQRPTTATYVSLIVTAKTCEKSTKAVIGSANTAIRLVFKIANTRPYYASSSAINTGIAKEPFAELYMDENAALGHSNYVDININEIAYDLDGTVPSFVTRATTDAPQFIKVPTNEYISVTRENALVALKNTSNYYDNNKADNIIATGDASAQSWFTGESGIATGFNSRVLADANDAAAAENACITYQYIGTDTLRLTARAATQNMYKTAGRTGDFYIMVRVSDAGDAGDYGIWFPIAVKVHSSAPRTPSTPASFTLGFDEYAQSIDGQTVAGAGNPRGVDVTTVGYVVDGVLNGVGTQTSGDISSPEKQSVPFVTDNDAFQYAPYNPDGTIDTNFARCERELNDVVMLNGSYAVGDVINADDETSAFFKLTAVKLYANNNVFKGLSAAQRAALGITPESGTSYSSFIGFRITPVRATDNYYFRYDVEVVDSHGVTAAVPVYVKVENRTLNRRLDITYDDAGKPNNFDEAYSINTTSYGKYENDAGLVGDKYINYTVKKSDVIRITPYDLAYDFDTPYEFSGSDSNIKTGASNPEHADFAAAAGIITNNYSTIRRTLAPGSDPADEPFAVGTKAQQLTFTNTESLKSSIRVYKNYLGAVGTDASSTDEEISDVVKESVTVDGTIYAVPCIEIEAKSRTGSGLLTLRFSVSDGYTSINYVISVTVLNAGPQLADNQVGKCWRMTAGSSTSDIVANSWQFRVGEVAKDIDGDILSFVSGSVKIVSLVNGEYVTTATDSLGNEYELSQFIDAVLTKNDTGEDVILVTARSSTQLFDTPIFVEFEVSDGYRAQPRTSVLHVQLEVENTAPSLVTTELIIDENENYNWDIKYEDTAEKTMERYIVNSAELYDYIPVSSSNKIMLFNDVDATQYALLNPYNGFPEENGANHTAGLVAKYVGADGIITSDAFEGLGVSDPLTQTAYKNAAVLYTPTYTAGTTENNDTYIKLEIVYYEKKADGVFGELSATSGEKIKKSNYWAIRIVDTCNSSEVGKPTQIAIAIKDNHHGNTIYEGNRPEVAEHRSDVTICNFYYRYLSPGITVMHEYYRSDGKVDASTIVTGKSDGEYVLDIDALNVSNHKYLFKDGVVPSSQSGLQEAAYADDYKYLYYASTKRTTVSTPEGNKTKVEFVPKVFADSEENAFYYRPVEVAGSEQAEANVATVMPISYVAMPTGYNTESGTENGTHVIFGNAYTSQQSSQNTLWDNGAEYVNWNEAVVFQNLTLTDSAGNEWSGRYTEKGKRLNDNPYIDIRYEACQTVLNSGLVNKKRYGVSANNTIAEFDWKVAGTTDTSKFREDKFGFSFTRKRDMERPSGLLKLTIELKTNDVGSAAVSVPVEISVENSKPVHVKYTNEFSYYLNNLSVKMRTSDSTGKYVELLRDGDQSVLDKNLGEGTDKHTVSYVDYDSTDVMKFLMSTATDKKLAGELSASDYAYIKNKTNAFSADGWSTYFNNSITPDYENFVPNPGYRNFFEVSPENGAASVLQFIPTAKTDIDLKGKMKDEITKILDLNHLAIDKDVNGNYVTNGNGGYDIYYPYRILFYDDLNGDGITNGLFFTAVIKVYIVNDEIKADSTVAPNEEYTDDGERMSYATYKFSLTKNINSSVDVSSFLIDNDIVLTEDTGTFAVESSDEWLALKKDKDTGAEFTGDDLLDASKNKQLVKDYLVMPTDLNSANNVLEGVEKLSSIKVSVSGTSDTTLVFTATSAFSGNISIKYTFSDSRGESVVVVFKITYRNEAPKANRVTFGGSDTISIVMHTYDTVVFHVADSNEFSVDTNGGFKSPTYFNYAQTGNVDINPANAGSRRNSDYYESGFSYPTATAKNMLDSFGYFAGTIDDATKKGNSLIIGEDDAASTLRFVRSAGGFPVGSFTAAGGSGVDFTRKFKVTASNFLATENTCGTANIEKRAMSVSVKALGVVTNAIYTLPLSDNGTTTEIKVIITVLPSAPTVDDKNSANLGKPDTQYDWIAPDGNITETYTYNVNLAYGDVKDIRLSAFMKDVDMDDSSRFYLPDIYSGSCFKIVNPAGVNAVVAEQVSNDADIKFLRLRATDYIPAEGEFATVVFRVSDAHGATSDEITFKVFVAPREMNVVASSIAREYEFNIMSYADYIADGDEEKTVELDLVSASGGAVINDADYDAPSALYDVAIYARFYLEEEPNTGLSIPREYKNMTEFNEEFKKNKYELHIADVIQAHGTDSFGVHFSNNDRANYVKRFFDVKPSEDGKKLLFTPKSATIGATGGLDKLRFCIKIGKQYTHTVSDGGVNTTAYTRETDAFVRISVANSAPVAIGNSSINYGYPLLENDVNRQADFLSFRGAKGDSLTWKLFDKDDEFFGLFYDYDMLNVDDGNGRETLSYGAARVLPSYTDPETGKTYQTPADAMSTTDPVLLFDADKETFTITIKRKVNPGIPGPEGAAASTLVPVEVSCMDVIGSQSAPATTVKTVILVTVENDTPEFKQVSSDNLKYTIEYDDFDGYVMRASIRTGDTLNVRLADVIDDADIDMDAYFFRNTGAENCFVELDVGASRDIVGVTGSGTSAALFSYTVGRGTNAYNTSTVNEIRITCKSAERGAVAVAELSFYDSTRVACTSRMKVYLTVDNTAPKAISENKVITLMGLKADATEDEVKAATFIDNIIHYVTDINPNDAVDAENSDSKTYVYISEIQVYLVGDVESPIMYGPGVETVKTDPVTGETETIKAVSVCSANWNDTEHHQKFYIELAAGVYGTQKIRFTVNDGGYYDGTEAGINDFQETYVDITVIVTCPIDVNNLPEFGVANKVTRKVTPELLLNKDDDEHRHAADGYVIKNITVADGSPLTITSAPAADGSGATEWFITANYITGAPAEITVTFDVGGKEVVQVLTVNITENHAPELRIGDSVMFSKGNGDLDNNNMVVIKPTDWFEDPDIDDVMRFVSPVKTKVSAYVDAHIDGGNIVLKFNGRGTTELTLNITDLSGTLYQHTIIIGCTDIPELNAWNSIVAKIQSNPLMWAIIAGGILLLIILLIIIIVVVRKKRRIRLEIEALLASEAELEEDMLRLSGGAVPYRSYGYLPPTTQTMNDPNLMLGTQAAPPPNSLQLNAGVGQPAQGAQPAAPDASAPQQSASAPIGNDGFNPDDF